ncbi:phage tail sheath family protein [Ideonella sp.]|uniref:phage tail sheath family protein n=1 Tax=Ideonella sp. TaxID=1929293 RepID=UPI0035B24ACE
MPSYLHPGVYVEELPSGNRPIEGVGTSTACFMGYCRQGPLNTPTLINNWDAYERTFGGLQTDTTVVAGAAAPLGDPMGHGVNAFFMNGGTAAYIVRLALGASAASGTINDGGLLLTVTAANPGRWANALVLRLAMKQDDHGNNIFLASVGEGTGSAFVALEPPQEVVPETGQPTSMQATINASSKLVQVTVPAGQEAALRAHLEGAAGGVTEVTMTTAGVDGNAPGANEYQDAFPPLVKIRDINILLLPGQTWDGGTGQSILNQAVAHCETTRNRMLVFDLPPALLLDNESTVQGLGLPTSTYAVTYYPWTLVANPFYSPDSNPAAPRSVMVSPASMTAGLWAKTDSRRGVWKAPAGIEFPLLGVSGLAFQVANEEQDYLNPQGVNALRRMPGFGPVVWGTRTRSTRANPEWRYVPVRRTAIFIEESIYGGIQWAVFEPNDHRLWSSLRTNIDSFMNGLFRAGAFQGEMANDAYFVRCGLGQTMTQDDIDRGMVIVLVAFAPLKPAEFVIVRIQQKVGQQ